MLSNVVKTGRRWPIALLAVAALLLSPLGIAGGSVALAEGGPPPRVQVIVQGRDLNAVADAVRAGGGEVKGRLGIINAVVVSMPETALKGLMHNPHVVGIYEDRTVLIADGGEAWTAVATVSSPTIGPSSSSTCPRLERIVSEAGSTPLWIAIPSTSR
jgi:hypothetical protein